ncbi:MAG TPA: type I DNA topoisomerase, partial [Candidatus Paceibacterota bacterium]|nr:type I DNA topoisomerase [Candidatus Paceibacterota bacterium]
VLDRLVGYDLSGLIWKKVRYGLSAGRVQSPALRILMEREREIRAFIPEDFFVRSGDFKSGKKEITLTCSVEPKLKKEAEDIEAKARAGTWNVTNIEKTEVKRSPRAPFITSTLQQVASTRLGFSPSRTMGVAQKLYEKGFITYMRTDSTTLSKQALGSIAGIIEKKFGKEYLEFHSFAKKSKNAQEAHEAIRPTRAEVLVAGHTEDEKKLYSLIWARAVSSQMKDAKLLRTKVTGNIADKSIPDFSATGSTVVFDGWLKGDPAARGEENILPEFKEGEALDLIDFKTEAKQTQPPSRYTEAGLIKELEKRGIGRPSTYASIIRTLEEREYVTKENKTLMPTDTGDVVSTFLETNFPSYISDGFTAEMEDKLDEIAQGSRKYVKTLKEFYTPFLKEVKEKDKLDKATTFGEADSKFKCPKCGSSMLIKLSRGGKFLSCSKYPDCDGALTLEGLEIKSDEPIGNDPATGLPIFVKTGRFGPYVQLGVQQKKGKKKEKKSKEAESAEVDPNVVAKPRMASIPKEYDPTNITVADALKFLSLPRTLGVHPETNKEIVANKGRFGPYIVHDGDFRSLKKDDVFTIELPRALEILAEPKKVGRARFKKKTK